MIEETKGKKTTAVKSTQTSKEVFKMIRSYYARAKEAKMQHKPVAWVMVNHLVEPLLKAMDIAPVYTEQYASICAVKKQALPLLNSAQKEGFSDLICGYVNNGIGYLIQRKELGCIPPNAPMDGMADPDMLIGSSHRCDPRYKWYQALGRYTDAPYFALDSVIPSIDADIESAKDYYIRYQVEELRRFQSFLERILHRPMDQDRLLQAIVAQEQTRRTLWDCYEMRKAIPCPMPMGDMISCIVPGWFNPCEQESLDFYLRLKQELAERIEQKTAVVPEEKFRLIWGNGVPPWHSTNIFNLFEDLGAVLVAEVVYYPDAPYEDAEKHTDPLERLAAWYFHRFTQWHNRAAKHSGHPEAERLLAWVEEYQADGIVFHGLRTCRATTMGQIFYKKLIRKYLPLFPVLFLESDLLDERTYSETKTKAQIKTFIEILANTKTQARSV